MSRGKNIRSLASVSGLGLSEVWVVRDGEFCAHAKIEITIRAARIDADLFIFSLFNLPFFILPVFILPPRLCYRKYRDESFCTPPGTGMRGCPVE
jgi:hypothetical protein